MLCTKCNLKKSLTEFPPDKNIKGGLRRQCRTCRQVDREKINYAPAMTGCKACTQCEKTLPVSEFSPEKRLKGGRQNQCRTCKNKSQRGRRQQSPSIALQYLHGMSMEYYLEELEWQNGVCKACGNPETERRSNGTLKPLSVDHDHNAACGHSGKFSCSECFRGLLCSHCNHALGFVHDDAKRLRNLIDYLCP